MPFPYIGVLFKVLTVIRTKGLIGDPPTIVGGNPELVEWRIHNIFEDCNESLPNPHAIITLTSDVPANNAKLCLTLHEMQAILGIMVTRTIHRPFCSHPLHPVSNEHLNYHIQGFTDGYLFCSSWFFPSQEKSTEE